MGHTIGSSPMHLSDLLHVDRNLPAYIHQYGVWFYGIMFLILFAETGLVVTPFLPGDTLLFAAGIFANPGQGLNLPIVLLVLTCAPILGDTVNYHIGKFFGPKIFSSETSKILNRRHLAETHEFFEKYGSQAVTIARWVPIVRTFAPFVGGMSGMPFRIFIAWSALGAVIWVWVCTLAGYFFGRIPWVHQNFELAMLAMVLITVMPIAHKIDKSRRARKVRPSATPIPAED
jgi:membrane-associated protein